MRDITIHKSDKFTTISNYLFFDNSISYKAKGLLAQMLSLPKDWDYSVHGLSTMSTDGESSISSALDELKRAGYVEVTHTKNDKGCFVGWHYDVYETPNRENPNLENPNLENPQQLNTNLINNLLNNISPIERVRERVKEILFDNTEALKLTLIRNEVLVDTAMDISTEALHNTADSIIDKYSDWLVETGREDIDRIGRIGIKTQFANWLRVDKQQKKQDKILKIKENAAQRNANDSRPVKKRDNWDIDRPYLNH